MAKAKDPTAGMTEAQRAYETKRAAKAGMTIEIRAGAEEIVLTAQ